jgi:hypothetical protein
VRESTPTGSVVIESCACPLLTLADPSEALPLKNCTDPVAMEGLTAAVRVIVDPKLDGFALLVRLVIVEALLTVCETAPEVLDESFASPA